MILFPFAGAELSDWGASVKRRKRSPLEDPVKNGACLSLKGRFWIDITGNTSNVWTREDKSQAQSLYYTYNDTTTNINTWKNKVELNDVEVDFENATYKIGDADVKFAELTYSDFGELASSSGTPISVPMPEVNLQEGVNTLKFTRLTGYAFNMHSFTFKASI